MKKPAQMKKRISSMLVLGTLVIGLSGFNVLLSIQLVALNANFYMSSWSDLGIAKTVAISERDLATIGEHLLAYFTGSVSSPQVEVEIDGTVMPIFKEHEIQHLEDVRGLFRLGISAKHACEALIVIGVFIATLQKEPITKNLQKALRLSCATLCVFVILIAAGAVFDFSKWWTTFHLAVFSNDLWLLDPQSDRLIQIFPEQFFYKAVTRIFVISLALTGLYLILSFLVGHIPTYHSKRDA
ncbi:MAG TPA: TIGR01906 family membrane protein [Bacillota bacterium]|nr:TIGR01906 family membrane protein [Bacillota bacterium]